MQVNSEVHESSGGKHRRRHRLLVIPFLALASLLIAAGCGGGDSSSSATTEAGADNAGLERAEAFVASFQKPAQWKAPGPAFDAAKGTGKKVAWISLNGTISFTQGIYQPFAAAMKEAGVSTELFDGKSDPQEWARGIDEAVGKRVDLIVIQAIPAELVKAPLDEAQQAGIPVVEIFNHDTATPPAPGTNAQVSYCYSCVGRMMANAAIASTGGEANTVAFMSSDVSNSVDVQHGIEAEFGKNCASGCEVSFKDVPVAQWATKLSAITQTVVKDQAINYLIAAYDDMTTSMIPGVHAGGAQDRVGLASFNANQGPMEALQKGDVLSVDVGSPLAWTGWTIGDQVLRVLTDTEPTSDSQLPYFIFTNENAAELNLDEPNSWYGDVDFEAEFKKLWGIG